MHDSQYHTSTSCFMATNEKRIFERVICSKVHEMNNMLTHINLIAMDVGRYYFVLLLCVVSIIIFVGLETLDITCASCAVFRWCTQMYGRNDSTIKPAMWCILQISATSSYITQVYITYTISTDDTNEIFDWMDSWWIG